MRNPPPVIHPFMVSSLFVLVCYREVQPFVRWEELLGIWLAAILVTYASFKLIKHFVTEPYKAALLTTIGISLICFTRDLAGFTKRSLHVPNYVFAPTCVLLAALLVFVVLRTSKNLIRLKMLLNVTISAMAVATVLLNHLYPVHFISRRDRPQEADRLGPLTQTNSRPDIYYLVFDSYTSLESLKRYWNYDNTPFVSFLQSNGFVVVPDAHANYDMTPRCIASTLNMALLTSPPPDLSSFGRVNRLCEIMDVAAVPRKLSDLGYDFINLSLFDIAGRPRFYAFPDLDYFSLFDVVFRKSIFSYVKLFRDLLAVKRIDSDLLEKLRIIAHQRHAQPRFVYAHVMLPHFPYFYDRRGERKWPEMNFYARDAFLEQLIYTSGIITNLVGDIQRSASSPPVIVLQGDHGYRFLPNEPEEHCTILNAYYLPNGRREWVYDGITPVNTFRMIFNHYFGANYEYVPDVSNAFTDQMPTNLAPRHIP